MKTIKQLLETYQQFLDKSPSNWGEEKVVAYGEKKGYKVIGVCGHGRIDGIVLFGLDAGDKKYVGKEAKVKTGQTVFRYATRNSMAGDIFPLVKIDVKKGLLYNLSQKSSEGEIEHAEFETKSVKLRYLRLAATANLRDITGFDPGFGSMKESVEEGKKPSAADRLTSRLKKGGVDLDKRAKDRKSEHDKLKKKYANESVDLDEGKMKEFHGYVKAGKSAEWISKKIGIDVKAIKDFMKDMKESNELQEGKNLIPDLQKIVKNKSAGKVGGVMIDMFTASVVTQAYDKVNPAMQKKMEASDINKLVGLVHKLLGHKAGKVEQVNEAANLFMKEYEDGEYDRGDEKPYVDAIKRGGGKNIKVDKPSRGDAMLQIEFKGGDGGKIHKLVDKVGDGTESVEMAEGTVTEAIKTFKDISEATMSTWTVTVQKPVNKLKKGDKQVVNARSAFEAINKAMKLWKDPALKSASADSFKITKESLDEASARADAMRAMGKRGKDSADDDNDATDDDRKAASKNVLMQVRKASDLPKGGDIEFENGKKGKISQDDAQKMTRLFGMLKKPQDKEKFQKIISKDLKSLQGLLKRLGKH